MNNRETAKYVFEIMGFDVKETVTPEGTYLTIEEVDTLRSLKAELSSLWNDDDECLESELNIIELEDGNTKIYIRKKGNRKE